MKEVKLPLSADDIILNLEDPKGSTGELQKMIKIFSRVPALKINMYKSITFLYTSIGNTTSAEK